MTRDLFRPLLPLVLSLNAGYVDTAGFLALQGLFTAHVTGNFVTLGASLVLGTSGAVAKLLALPVFCLVVILARLLSSALLRRRLPALKVVLGVKFALLLIGAVLAIHFGPFTNGDAGPQSSRVWCWSPPWLFRMRLTVFIWAAHLRQH